jgi:hypothetical protein
LFNVFNLVYEPAIEGNPEWFRLQLPGPRDTWDDNGNLNRVDWLSVVIHRLNKSALPRCGEWYDLGVNWEPYPKFKEVPGLPPRVNFFDGYSSTHFASVFLHMHYTMLLYQHNPLLYLHARNMSPHSDAGKELIAFWAAARMM